MTEEGTATSPPAVKQIDNMGNVTTKLTASDLATGTIVSPLTGIVFGPADELDRRPRRAGRGDFAI